MARKNEYDSTGRIILRDTRGTIISMYRFMELVLGPNSHPWAPPYYWGGYGTHKGYDFGAPAWTEIRSTCTGNVVQSNGGGAWHGGMGNSVVVEETGIPEGYVPRFHRYMHMVTDPVVRLGDVVQQGTLLGYVGTTGDSDGTHLHYDVASWSGGGTIYDAWDQFNHSSEPAGWTPYQVTLASGSPRGRPISWACIDETTGIDYGPGGAGGVPSEVPKEFNTNKQIHDVAWCNITNLNSFSPATVGGLIIQIGNMGDSSDTINHLSDFKKYVAKYKGIIPLGFYIYSYISFTNTEAVMKRKFQVFAQALATEGITPNDAPIGIWLDLEWDGPSPTADRSLNFNQVKWFREVFAAKGYPTVGLYTAPGYITSYFNVSDCAQIPLWMACWVSSDGTSIASSKSAMGPLLISVIGQADYEALKDSIYLWQDGSVSYPAGLVDHDWLIQPIPGIGYSATDPDDDNGDVAPEFYPAYMGTPELVPAYVLTISPAGGWLTPDTRIQITTDAPDSSIWYTLDNSTPDYQHSFEYGNGQAFRKRIAELDADILIRARAFDATGTVLAEGSAVFKKQWVQPEEHSHVSIEEADVSRPILVYAEE